MAVFTTIAAHEAGNILKIGQVVRCVYPFSGGGDQAREGTVEKVTQTGVTLKLSNGFGYRTLNYDRVVDSVIHYS